MYFSFSMSMSSFYYVAIFHFDRMGILSCSMYLEGPILRLPRLVTLILNGALALTRRFSKVVERYLKGSV